LRTTGLPYAQDAAITRHLAAFLGKQQGAADDLKDVNLPEHATFLHPTAVLFNGGVLKGKALADRLIEVLNSWLAAETAPEARLLAGADLDLAVARGAAYYGYVRKGKGVRIKGGTAASYYVGVESAMPAVPGMAPELNSAWWSASRCVSVSLPRPFAATTGSASGSITGPIRNCRSWTRSKSLCRKQGAGRATSFPCICAPPSPKSEPSNFRPFRRRTAAVGRSSSTSGPETISKQHP
jgi:hypothetical protein